MLPRRCAPLAAIAAHADATRKLTFLQLER